MKIKLEFDQEEDGRWIAEIPDWPGVMAYGACREEAARRVQALALRVIADRLEHGELMSCLNPIAFTGVANEPVAIS